MIDRQRNEESFGTIGTCRNSLLLIRKYYDNNKVGVVFAKHTRMVVLFVEVDEHENTSVVAHDISCAYVITLVRRSRCSHRGSASRAGNKY